MNSLAPGYRYRTENVVMLIRAKNSIYSSMSIRVSLLPSVNDQETQRGSTEFPKRISLANL